jgi:transcriptional regulator with XRE-family HTH domain
MATKAMKRDRQDSRRDVLRTLGAAVRACRHERGLTQGALADLLGVSVAYVSLIERGGRNPPFTTVVAIAQALGVAPRELVDD